MKVHELKILTQYYEAVIDGTKTFEIRKNDRHFRLGDSVLLREFDEETGYTGRQTYRQIGFITGYAQENNYVVFSILPCVGIQNEP